MRSYRLEPFLVAALVAACHAQRADLPRPLAEVALTDGAAFLDSVVQARASHAPPGLIYLAATTSLGHTTTSHSNAWLREMLARLRVSGICRPPEEACFDGKEGILLVLGQPYLEGSDTLRLEAHLAYYSPDARYTRPPGAAAAQPPGAPIVPSVTRNSSTWKLGFLIDRAHGSIRLSHIGMEIASDGL